MSRRGWGAPDGGRISIWQLAFLLIIIPAIEDSTAIDHWLALRVGVDGWLSVLLAVPVILLGVALLVALADRFPQQDLAGILLRVLGPLAYPVGILYTALFLADAALSLREFGLLGRLEGFMSYTPYTVFAICLILVATYGAWLGMEVVARINAAILLFAELPLGVMLALFAVNHQKLVRLLPILANGLQPVLWGAWLVAGKFGELVLMLVFLPLVAKGRANARGVMLWAVVLTTFMALGHELGPVLTFGASVRTIEWPDYSQVRAIALARFIANLDWLVVTMWTHGFLIEVIVFMYAAALTLARLFGMRSHRALIPVLAAVVLVATYFSGRTQDAVLFNRWLLDAYGFVGLGWVLPALLLGISLVRGQGTRSPTLRRVRRQSRSVLRSARAQPQADGVGRRLR